MPGAGRMRHLPRDFLSCLMGRMRTSHSNSDVYMLHKWEMMQRVVEHTESDNTATILYAYSAAKKSKSAPLSACTTLS